MSYLFHKKKKQTDSGGLGTDDPSRAAELAEAYSANRQQAPSVTQSPATTSRGTVSQSSPIAIPNSSNPPNQANQPQMSSSISSLSALPPPSSSTPSSSNNNPSANANSATTTFPPSPVLVSSSSSQSQTPVSSNHISLPPSYKNDTQMQSQSANSKAYSPVVCTTPPISASYSSSSSSSSPSSPSSSSVPSSAVSSFRAPKGTNYLNSTTTSTIANPGASNPGSLPISTQTSPFSSPFTSFKARGSMGVIVVPSEIVGIGPNQSANSQQVYPASSFSPPIASSCASSGFATPVPYPYAQMPTSSSNTANASESNSRTADVISKSGGDMTSSVSSKSKKTSPKPSPHRGSAGGVGAAIIGGGEEKKDKRAEEKSAERRDTVDGTSRSSNAPLPEQTFEADADMRQLRADMLADHVDLSKLKLGETLGTGTFGRVRLCTYMQNGRIPRYLALKCLKKAEIIRLKQVEHIKQEKDILSEVHHPFIVYLLCTFQDERTLYMCMEYIIGGELFSQLRREGRFTNAAAKFYASEIVLALEHLHSLNIVYRDLKPENLLLDKDGHIKITDFGFAKKVEDRTWTLCGTPEYLAPEIIQSKGHGKAVDWWAIGILIYEMLAGYPPFYDENPFGIYQKILAGKIDFPKHFDPNAKDLIKKLLTPDRSKRYGCLKNGAADVKRHKWFKSLEWDKCLQRRLPAPFVPQVAGAGDTSNFDKYPDSAEDPQMLSESDDFLFKNF